jgi:signal transduction histidine kinase
MPLNTLANTTMLTTMSESPRKSLSSQSFRSNLKANIDLAEQMQEQITTLQQALELELTLRRIVDAVRDSLDEVHILKTAVQELALELKADCYASSSQNSEANQPLEEKDFQVYFNAKSSHRNLTQFTCPIARGNEQLGSLWVSRESSRPLTNSEIDLVQQVANQCAIAIHQSRHYQTAQKQVEELKHLNEIKDKFLNRVTHDLRAPLTNMRLAIYMLEHQLTAARSHCGHFSEQNSACSKTLEHLEILETECEREITLVNDLLDLQRLESDKQTLGLADVIDLREWLTDLIQPFAEKIQQRQITLNLQIVPNLPPLVSDVASLHRVLSELLHNASKYTPPHETISLSVASELDSVQIKVCNSGVEIPDEELPRIFNKFYRIPGSDRWKQGGTGLGLALVKEMVMHLGGSIWAESGNRQTNFVIQLPLLPSA